MPFNLQFILQDIFWAETPLLEAVSPNEIFIKELKETLHRTIIASFIPLHAYAKRYEDFIDLASLEIKEYIA